MASIEETPGISPSQPFQPFMGFLRPACHLLAGPAICSFLQCGVPGEGTGTPLDAGKALLSIDQRVRQAEAGNDSDGCLREGEPAFDVSQRDVRDDYEMVLQQITPSSGYLSDRTVKQSQNVDIAVRAGIHPCMATSQHDCRYGGVIKAGEQQIGKDW
jgi:hypothetical protein